MKVKEITAILEEAAPLFLQESYDNSGLLVGDPEAEIDSALICVDATEVSLPKPPKWERASSSPTTRSFSIR